mgnify:CR=1 FL=1
MNIPENPPAFPVVHTVALPPTKPGEYSTNYLPESHNGMNLRDYFAAKAMQVVFSKYMPSDLEGWVHLNELELIGLSYQIADSMLAERQKHL